MKKIIIKKKLAESSSNYQFGYQGDETQVDKINKRIVRAIRAAEAAEQAAKAARVAGNIDQAEELEARAEEIRAWANLDNNKHHAQGFSDVSPFKNPFEEEPKGTDGPGNPPSKLKKPDDDEDEFERMKKILKMLQGGEKAGASKALNDILNGTVGKAVENESLQEVFNLSPISKDITEIDDDEFEDIISSTVDAVNQVTPLSISTDVQARVKEIEKDLSSKNTLTDIARDNQDNSSADRAKKLQHRQEIERYKGHGPAEFKNKLRLVLADQVSTTETEEDSWSELNRRHYDDGILVPGSDEGERKSRENILITVYLDSSTSFTEADIEKERSLLAVLNQFVEEGNRPGSNQPKVEVRLRYFANTVHATYEPARREGRTDAWPYIIDEVKSEHPTNVIVITDSDMERDCTALKESYRAPGVVFYLWKGSKAESLPEYLKGISGTYEYWLS